VPSENPLLPREPLAPKVPEITLMFWIIKIITTGMGEATSDFFGTVSVPIMTAVAIVGLLLALWIQGRVRRYVAPAYWFVVMAIAVVGTEVADDLHGAGMPYYGSAAIYAILLTIVLTLWYRSEGTLSIHSIVTRRREAFYWLTVLATFALGTALGDFSAENLGLGLLASGLIYGGIILIPALGWWKFKFNAVFAFWFAYIVTRPLGASFADYLDKPHSGGGLDLHNGPVSAASTLVVVLLVAFVTVRRVDIQAAPDRALLPDAETAAD
jgi:uncharacterized membrane-anchored protein